jgi:uncharacterized protein YjbI with pentapeptide repeats
MVYLNNDDGLYYQDAEFTNIANGIAPFDRHGEASNTGDILYVNGVPTLHKNSGDGLWYTDQGFTTLANGPTGLTKSDAAWNEIWFINGQQTWLHEDGSGNWNGKNYRNGEADFTGAYAGGMGLTDGFYVNGVLTTLSLWGGHGVWNNKIYGSNANETHLDGFTCYIQTDNYGGFTKLADLTDVDFSSVVSVAGANFSGLDLSGLDFSRFTDWSRVNFGCSAKVVGANFSGVNFTNNGTVYSNLCFDDASGADFSGAHIGDFSTNAGLAGVNFSNTVFTGDISWRNFSGANLAGADFSNVTNWNGANFTGVNLTGVTLPDDMSGSIGISGIINNKPYLNSSKTNLNSSYFPNQDLTGVDFSEVTSMVNANFEGSTLTGANFSNVTTMEGAAFNGATLTGATFPSNISGSYGNVYFISGQATGLDGNGTGAFEGLRYENGTLFTGDFDGQTYVNGVVQGGGGGSENTLAKIQGNAKFYGKVKFVG